MFGKNSKDLKDTLDIRYRSSYCKKHNPKFSYKDVDGLGKYNQAGHVIKNGKRSLYVRTFDSKFSDNRVRKTGIVKSYNGEYILNVKNKDRKDYDLLTRIIDKALKLR